MSSPRLKKSEEKYQKYLKNNKNTRCPLCYEVGLKTFKYWKILKNNFPYDKIAQKHQMLVPFRHVIEDNLTQKELAELKKIKNTYIKNSDFIFIMETICNKKSLPSHFHLHLIKPK